MSRNLEMASLLMAISALSDPPAQPERTFLQSRGWIPFGANCTTGLEGWGKLIDGKAVIVDQPEALAMERYPK
jgi:hypothetical protein